MRTPQEVLLSRHRNVEPKLDEIWRATLRRGLRDDTDVTERVPPMATLWRELIWPYRWVWTGLACAWVLIAVLNFASREPATQVASKATPRSPEEIHALVEQRRMLVQLIGPWPEPAERGRSVLPGPRSERCPQFLNT